MAIPDAHHQPKFHLQAYQPALMHTPSGFDQLKDR